MSEEVVLLTPIAPSPDGPGLSMRAHQLVRALAAKRRVHVRVVPVQERNPAEARRTYSGPYASYETLWRAPNLFHRLRFHRDAERRRVSHAIGQAVSASVAQLDPSAIIAFRHYLMPLGFILRGQHPKARLVVDLDELESHTRESLSALHRLRGERRAARSFHRQALHYAARERVELASANQLWVCSAKEAERVEESTHLRARVVPNVVDYAESASSASGDAFAANRTLLFVGGLGYRPNLDAVEWFASAILPILRQNEDTTLRVVGAVPPAAQRSLQRLAGVELAGRVDALGAEYARADLVVVPIRAGGGTRIKLLEGLAHGRPVVSTPIGVEGLELTPGRDLMIAEDRHSFARACEGLLSDRARALAMAESGQQRVRDAYSPARLASIVDEALRGGDSSLPTSRAG